MSDQSSRIPVGSMTLREQVCLQLLIPESGTEWLDDIISKALRMEFEKIQYNVHYTKRVTLSEELILDYSVFIDEALGNSELEKEGGATEE